jgi:uncharacterized protein YkwD
MKNATLRLATTAGLALALSAGIIAPANAAPVAANAALSVQSTVAKAPTVTINILPNSTFPNTSARRVVWPSYSKPVGASIIYARLSIKTVGGKLITPSATSYGLGVGTYNVTTNVYYSYKQGTKTIKRLVTKTQVLHIDLKKPAPAPAPVVTIQPLANSTTTSPTAIRNIRPIYVAAKGAKPIYARVKVTSGSKVITNSATSVNLTPGVYQVTSTVHYSYVQGGKTLYKTVTKNQTLTITYKKPIATQPGVVSFEQGVINAFNGYRAKAGLPPLKTTASLNAYNTRWVNSNFASDEEPWSISDNLNFISKTQSRVSSGYTPASFAAQVMEQSGGKDIIYRSYVDHISVVRKSDNGGLRIGVLFVGITP